MLDENQTNVFTTQKNLTLVAQKSKPLFKYFTLSQNIANVFFCDFFLILSQDSTPDYQTERP